jgi:hypothetical protein
MRTRQVPVPPDPSCIECNGSGARFLGDLRIPCYCTDPLPNDEPEPAFRPVSAAVQREIDDALGLQAISIRLQKDLIGRFKELSLERGIGYQPLMRYALERFASKPRINPNGANNDNE